MLYPSLIALGIGLCYAHIAPENMMNSPEKNLSYLALGDSYTIGEGVPEQDRYPVQLVHALNQKGKNHFSLPKIIATTGWTVDELEAGIKASEIAPEGYDLVTLLIGVNNQYRGRSVESFKAEFDVLLDRAISFARGNKNHVAVLSIPDWGITPFALQKAVDQEKVAREIDAYNQAKQDVCSEKGVIFVEITSDYREIGAKAEMVVEDQLHPSGKVYMRWTENLLQAIEPMKF